MFQLEQADLQKIADYLQLRPWREVNDLIGLILAAKPVEPEESSE